METMEIQQNLQRIDASAKALWNEINHLSSQSAESASQAEYNRSMAENVMSSVTEDDDYLSKAAMARSYMDRADYFDMLASGYENQASMKKSELREYIVQYDYYKGECEKNIQNLNISVQKLMTIANSKYSSGLTEALNTAKQKLQQNNQYKKGCINRINSITEICGDNDGQKQKILKRI